MRTPQTRRSRCVPGLLALCLLGLLPELVSAQANALFPDIYIKRKRPCTELENPQYRMMREQFYGYYPTCWRQFPQGWGCVSPDAPDWAKSLEKVPLQKPPGTEEAEPEAGGTGLDNSPFRPRPATDGNRPGLELPEERSLLPDTKPPLTPPAGVGTPPAAPGAAQPSPLDRNDEPFGRTRPQASVTPTPAPDLPAGLRLEAGDVPALAPPGAALPAALPIGESASALPADGTPTNGRRGLMSQWFGRFRRR